MESADLQVARELRVGIAEEVGAYGRQRNRQGFELRAAAKKLAEMLGVARGSRMRVPETILGPRAMLEHTKSLPGRLHNGNDSINSNGGNARKMELLQLRRRPCNRIQVVVGDGHEVGVAEDLEPPQLAKVDRLERLQVKLIVLVFGLLLGRVDREKLQGAQWLAATSQQCSPGLGVHVTDRGPRERDRGKVSAVLQRFKDESVRFGGVEAVEPHAPDLGSNRRVLGEGFDGVLERREGVPVDSSARWPIDHLVQPVAFTAVGEFGPSLLEG